MSAIGRDSDDPVAAGTPLERAALDALERAVVVTGVDGEIILWNRSAEELYGWSEADVVGRAVADVFVSIRGNEPDDDIVAHVLEGKEWAGDVTVMHRGGDALQVSLVARPLLDRAERIVGIVDAAEDVTHRRGSERQAADLTDRLALALDAGGLGTWRWEIGTGVVEINPKLEELFGLHPGSFDGTYEGWQALLHPDDRGATLQTLNDAIDSKGTYVVQHRVTWADGSEHWLQGKGRVVLDDSGEVAGTIGCSADVTEQVRHVFEQEESRALAIEAAATAQRHRERLQFVGAINDALSHSDDERQLMRNVTATAVPGLGDWCAIFVLPESGPAVPLIEVAHVDPAMVDLAKELQQRFPYDPSAPKGVPEVIRSGRSEIYPHIGGQPEPTDVARSIVRSLGVRSAMAVPLVKRGRVLGAMQFANSDPERAYSEADLALAEAVANRIASTLTNIRLTEHQRVIATTLQASLLPRSLPDIPGLEVAVRYWAAGEGTEVGGDFYDVFAVDTGWAVVIGDVCGTGPEAASLTGLVRHTIRALAWQNGPHDEVLRQLNNAVIKSGRATFCTAVFSTLERTAAGFRFEMASGGHPLPILHRARSGRTETVGKPGTLIGAYPDSRSYVVTTELQAGDTLVLYTDGITDVRPPHDLSPEALQEIVARSAACAHSASDVVDALGREISAVLPITERNDDIAILVLRVPADQSDDRTGRSGG